MDAINRPWSRPEYTVAEQKFWNEVLFRMEDWYDYECSVAATKYARPIARRIAREIENVVRDITKMFPGFYREDAHALIEDELMETGAIRDTGAIRSR